MQLRGDPRLRSGWQDFDTRDETRHRFRIGVYSFDKYPFDIKFRLASGSGGAPTSANQTFDAEFSDKLINLDRIFVTYTPSKQLKWKETTLKLHGGKMANPMWRSELTWDGDINPEGFAEQVSFTLTPKTTLAFNLGQSKFPADNSSRCISLAHPVQALQGCKPSNLINSDQQQSQSIYAARHPEPLIRLKIDERNQVHSQGRGQSNKSIPAVGDAFSDVPLRVVSGSPPAQRFE